MMVIKKGIGDSLIYLTLIVTALRSVRYPIENFFQFNSSDNGPSTTVNLFINFGHLYSENEYSSSKTDFLIQETLNVFRDINSLGRYSSRYSTNLYAYLVNGDESNQTVTVSSTLPLPEVNSTSHSVSGCLTFPSSTSPTTSTSSSPLSSSSSSSSSFTSPSLPLSLSLSSSSPSSPLSEQETGNLNYFLTFLTNDAITICPLYLRFIFPILYNAFFFPTLISKSIANKKLFDHKLFLDHFFRMYD